MEIIKISSSLLAYIVMAVRSSQTSFFFGFDFKIQKKHKTTNLNFDRKPDRWQTENTFANKTTTSAEEDETVYEETKQAILLDWEIGEAVKITDRDEDREE